MKSLFFTLSLFICTPIFAQDKLGGVLPLQNGLVTFSDVVTADSVSQIDLYQNAKRWFVTTYKSAKDVIQLDDKETGEIIGKGVFKIDYFQRKPSIYHTISIKVKDGRYKYTITDLSYSDVNGSTFNIEDFPSAWMGKKKLYTNIAEEVEQIATSIKTALLSKPAKDDW
jgi:hypothetical protein